MNILVCVFRLPFLSQCLTVDYFNEARPRERVDRGRFLPIGENASS